MSEIAAITQYSRLAEPVGFPLHWYAVYTKPSHEKRVKERLGIRGVETFLPIYRLRRDWKNGCHVTLEMPLFPGYVFVQISPFERIRILEVPSVICIVGNGRKPIPLSEAEVERLRCGLHLLNPRPHSFLAAGEMVRIRCGPLQGMNGIVIRKKNALQVVISLDLIRKSVAVEVSADDIEAIAQPSLVACGVNPSPRHRAEIICSTH